MELLEIIKTFAGLGLGVWNIILFRNYRRLNKAKVSLETQETWRKIAESNNEQLIKYNEDFNRLWSRVFSLERILHKIASCRYYPDVCPVSSFVQEYKRKYKSRNTRQSPIQQKGVRLARDNPGIISEYGDTDSEPP